MVGLEAWSLLETSPSLGALAGPLQEQHRVVAEQEEQTLAGLAGQVQQRQSTGVLAAVVGEVTQAVLVGLEGPVALPAVGAEAEREVLQLAALAAQAAKAR